MAQIVEVHEGLVRYGDGNIDVPLVGTGANRLIVVIGTTRATGSSGFDEARIGTVNAAITDTFEAIQSDYATSTSIAIFNDAQHPGAGTATITLGWGGAANAAITVYEIANAPQAAPFYTIAHTIITTTITNGAVLTQNVTGEAGKLGIALLGMGDSSAFDTSVALSANLANGLKTDNNYAILHTAQVASIADADEDFTFTVTLNSGSAPRQGVIAVLSFGDAQKQVQKPANISGLNTDHYLNSKLLKLYEFGQLDKELVGDVANTTTATTASDADLGDCKLFDATGDALTETFTAPDAGTVLVIWKGNGTRDNGDPSKISFVSASDNGNKFNLFYDGYNGGDLQAERRGSYGTNRILEENIYSTDGEYTSGNAVAATFAETATMKMAVNGAIEVGTNTETTGAFSAPFQVSVLDEVGAEGAAYVAAIAIFNDVLTDDELISVTTTPYALLSTVANPFAVTLIDGDNDVYPGQTGVTVTMTNAAAVTSIDSAILNGTALTNISYTPGANTFTCDIPEAVAQGTPVDLDVNYTE